MAKSQDNKNNGREQGKGGPAAAAGKTEASADVSDIRQKLAKRMAFAGVMIVALLGGLALFDYYSAQPEVEPVAKPFTEPVPVPKKVTTQPVTPVDPNVTKAPEAAVKAAEPEATSAPAGKGTPPPPEVAAHPSTPPASRPTPAPMARATPPSATVVAPSSAAATASTPSATTAPPRAAEPKATPAPATVRSEATPAPVPSASVTQPPPAPPRLFSGFALQAGVFADPRRAEELLARLTLEGIPATIESRVQVGPFKNRAEADAAREKLKALGIDAVLLVPRSTRH